MKIFTLTRWLCGAVFAWGATAIAISPAELQRLLDSGESMTFMDVRANTLFQQGHIPGAINVPAALVSDKQLPPLGRVVVYDDGLGLDTATSAASALNQKAGIKAEVLDGGFAAWESTRGATTKAIGMKSEETPFITFAELEKAQSEVVLVDLRKEPVQLRQSSAMKAPAVQPAPLTDLRQQFTNVRGITRSPFDLPQTRQSSADGISPPPLLVLIDGGDGAALTMARTLKANGISRFAILAGGEKILARQGQGGLGRASSTIVVRRPSAASITTTNQ